ncbi:HAMP domain-containing protein [Bradyrhizobium manausense]|uniref:methyl-accepting chemotaxis protein n=1 Tax=Bradyrhizobium manausense TaxID=989370 RepID=UPI001BA768CC|nr:HAMP domain-containing methyl-accepting chemotaxis protein [Bradyrhizobium manausense]MBR0828617.1 HAMP domain-containing protein [Bradyrhizobium manausense]
MRIITDAPIAVKSLIAPLISAAIMVAIVGLFISVHADVQRMNDKMVSAAELVSQTSSATIAFSQAHADLYRAVSLKSQNVETRIIRDAKQSALSYVARALATTESLLGNGLADQGMLGRVEQSLKDYAKAAQLTADVVEDDAFIAAMDMNDAQQQFSAAKGQIDPLMAAAVQVRDAVNDESRRVLGRAVYQIGGAAGLAILLSLALALFFGRLVSRPIATMTAIMKRLASGDLAVAVPGLDRRDEVGAMAQAVEVFRNNAHDARRLADEQSREHVARAKRNRDLEELVQCFGDKVGEVIERLTGEAGDMRRVVQTLGTATAEASERSSVVASASEETSANVQTVASAAEELAASIVEISRQVQISTSVAQRAVDGAQQTSMYVTTLSEGAQKIGDVVALINGIASQTNLLALNATIEAARAGDAGRGFAIVASEVKSLATQTAKATEDIARQIAEIQVSTRDAVVAIQDIGSVIAEINEITVGISAAVEEQGAATKEIARNVQEAARGTQEVSGNISSVKTAVADSQDVMEQVRRVAEGVAAQSSELSENFAQFQLGMRAA